MPDKNDRQAQDILQGLRFAIAREKQAVTDGWLHLWDAVAYLENRNAYENSFGA